MTSFLVKKALRVVGLEWLSRRAFHCAVLAFVLASCQHLAAEQTLPDALRERLTEHPRWLTVASVDAQDGAFPPSDLFSNKSWRVIVQGGKAVALQQEKTSSILSVVEPRRQHDQNLRRVDLDRRLDLASFLAHADSLRSTTLKKLRRHPLVFRPLDHQRFSIDFDQGRGRVVFIPADDSLWSPPPPSSPPAATGFHSLGRWSAPFGPESEIFAYALKLAGGQAKARWRRQVRPGPLLSHESWRLVRVEVDPSVPAAFYRAIDEALQRWNEALGRQLFDQVRPLSQPIDVSRCLALSLLCIRWRGSEQVAYSGMSAYTDMSFDPVTGVVLGGVVSLINGRERPLVALPEAERIRVRDGKLSWDELAQTVLDLQRATTFLHPAPAAYVRYLLLHELGHFNGLGHNFYVERDSSPSRPSASVMTYPPFPVAHLIKEVGQFDMWRLRERPASGAGKRQGQGDHYDHRPNDEDGATAAAGAPFCSTLDVLVPELDPLRFARTDQCDVYAVGDLADWYLRLARLGKEGVYASYPPNLTPSFGAEHSSYEHGVKLPPALILTRLGALLKGRSVEGEAGRRRIHSYLCRLARRRPQIVAQLRQWSDFNLHCRDDEQSFPPSPHT